MGDSKTFGIPEAKGLKLHTRTVELMTYMVWCRFSTDTIRIFARYHISMVFLGSPTDQTNKKEKE